MKKLILLLVFSFFVTSSLTVKASPREGEMTVKYFDQNPPSCEIIAHRMKLASIQLSEISYYADKIDRGFTLNGDEIHSIKVIAQQFIPQFLDPIDREVEVTLIWQALKSEQVLSYYTEGPGFNWSSSRPAPPLFMQLSFGERVTMTYRMSIFDYCFNSENFSLWTNQTKKGGEPQYFFAIHPRLK